ncbi:MAG: tryptophan-rich sensory protein, partial [Alphaproteobacteria bacterium]|nr:tryptophan-rich sensory protein [Alphaproteobacteria bacterium]
YLQYPYLLWLLFATYLNAGVWYLNGVKAVL